MTFLKGWLVKKNKYKTDNKGKDQILKRYQGLVYCGITKKKKECFDFIIRVDK